MAVKKEYTVRAKQREGRGKNDARRARRDGMVPITVYGGGTETVAALAPLSELAAILRSEAGRNTIFTIDVEGIGASEVMFHERQVHPVRGRLIHADLTRLVKGQKIDVTVRIHLVGEPAGVRDEQGVLEQVVREIEIRCEPRDIPDSIDVDVSHLGVHEVLHVSDIVIGENIEFLAPMDLVVATVGMMREEAAAAPTIEGEESVEPEVIGKGKKEGEGEESE
jgi:large subunit ribosomal protein L25